MTRTVAAARIARISQKPKSSKKKTEEGLLMAYRQLMSQRLETYVHEDVVAEEHNDILFFTQETNTRRIKFHNAFWMKIIRVPHDLDK